MREGSVGDQSQAGSTSSQAVRANLPRLVALVPCQGGMQAVQVPNPS